MVRMFAQKTKQLNLFWRGLYGIELEGVNWVVEVDYLDFSEKVRLFRDGVLAFENRSPARFEIAPNIEIQATMALYGMKRIHLVDSVTGDVKNAAAAAWNRRICEASFRADTPHDQYRYRSDSMAHSARLANHAGAERDQLHPRIARSAAYLDISHQAADI